MFRIFLMVILFLVVLFQIPACGGDTSRNIAGTYRCAEGCNGVCAYPESFVLTQVGDQIQFTLNQADFSGTINDLDVIEVSSSSNASCAGSVRNERDLELNCQVTSATCQTVLYQLQ